MCVEVTETSLRRTEKDGMATRKASYGNFSQWENIYPVPPEKALKKCHYNIFSEVEGTQPKFN